jgi:hypothetical protein
MVGISLSSPFLPLVLVSIRLCFTQQFITWMMYFEKIHSLHVIFVETIKKYIQHFDFTLQNLLLHAFIVHGVLFIMFVKYKLVIIKLFHKFPKILTTKLKNRWRITRYTQYDNKWYFKQLCMGHPKSRKVLSFMTNEKVQ